MALTTENFELVNLAELSTANVNQILTQIVTQLQELNPNLDLKRGVFKDTVAYYHAILETALRTNLERYQSARSLQQIIADPTLADTGIVDELLSNWGITRASGTAASGSITLEFSKPTSVVIPSGFAFSANGRNYVTTQTFISRQSAAQITNDTDRLIVQLSNGNYAFTVDVVAEATGSTYKLNAGDLILPVAALANFVTSYATSSFEAGTDTETNESLVNKLQQGIAAKTLSNRVNMRAYLRSIAGFSSVTNQSIIGYGDAEMLRDKHSIIPIAYGGRVDWYIRGQQPLKRQTTTVSAVCISISDNTSNWQFSINRNALPGFYTIEKIRRASDANLDIEFDKVSETRSLDFTDLSFVPDVINTTEGAYTAYQTAIVVFTDTATPVSSLSVGQTESYICELTGTPHIREIQNLVSSRDVRSYAADALIKAPVPCFVQVTFTINKTVNDASPDVDAIKLDIVALINQIDFCGRLDASRIVDTVHNYLSNNMAITDMDLFGTIRRPDGSILYLRDNDSLVIPDEYDRMVTSKTVQFFTEVSNISVNVSSTIPTAV